MLIPGRMYKRVSIECDEYTIGRCYEALATNRLIDNFGEISVGSCNYFELQPKEPEEKQMDYQFSVSSDKLISTYEIQDSLTRQHPMAIVHRSDGMHTVVLHDSIMDKLVVCSKDIIDQFFEAMEPYDVSPDGYVPTTGGCLTPIVKAVRAVRNAKIVIGKPCDVKVVFPEI